MKAVVIGGSGQIGSLITDHLLAAGHEVGVASRSTGVDVVTGAGLGEALAGADVVVDATNIETRSKSKAVKFFESAAQNIVNVVRTQNVTHLVTVSIYNAGHPEAAANGYYAGKAAQEQLVRTSGVPATIVGSTQWYELGETILRTAKFGPIIIAPTFLSRPASADAVAARIAEVAQGAPQVDGVVIAGPEERDFHDLVSAIATKRGVKGKILRITPPGMGAMRSGVLVPPADVPGVGPTFEEWLARN